MWWSVLEDLTLEEADYGFKIVARSTQYGDVEPAHIREAALEMRNLRVEAMIAANRRKFEESRASDVIQTQKGCLSDEERAANRALVAGLVAKIAGMKAVEKKIEEPQKWRWDESVDFSQAHNGIIIDSLPNVKN